MTLPKIRYVLGAMSFALVAFAMAPLPASAAAGDTASSPCMSIWHTASMCPVFAGTYYICQDGTIHLDNGVNSCPSPIAVVEKPASAPPPTAAEATPPASLHCQSPRVATNRAGTWICRQPPRIPHMTTQPVVPGTDQ